MVPDGLPGCHRGFSGQLAEQESWPKLLLEVNPQEKTLSYVVSISTSKREVGWEGSLTKIEKSPKNVKKILFCKTGRLKYSGIFEPRRAPQKSWKHFCVFTVLMADLFVLGFVTLCTKTLYQQWQICPFLVTNIYLAGWEEITQNSTHKKIFIKVYKYFQTFTVTIYRHLASDTNNGVHQLVTNILRNVGVMAPTEVSIYFVFINKFY